ncbi:MAG: RNase adapter RapZ [Succinivibrionaceae bacterium]
MKLFIVSGRSGAGKTIALRVLEDLNYNCIDNLPIDLLPEVITLSIAENHNKMAVSVDIRNIPSKPEKFIKFLSKFRSDDENELISIFLDADDSTLIKRYEETRRLHPLSKQYPDLSLEESIKAEHGILDQLSDYADIRIDTSSLSIHELSEEITSIVLGKKGKNITIVFESFGFKNGIVKDADFVFDARFLPNPHWVPELRLLTGLDKEVHDFFSKYPEVQTYIQHIDSLIDYWLPFIERNNRSYLTIAIGCTGGQHRSVFIAESLGKRFKLRNKNVIIKHKSLKK